MGDSLGDNNPFDGETPQHTVRLSSFTIDATTITNEQFQRFIDDSQYVTDAERFGFSAVFHQAVDAPDDDIIGPIAGSPWWIAVRHATWQQPGGRCSTIDSLAEHPAVHISWNDAVAYCTWARRRLPTEAEWEAGSRGGQPEMRYPWGDELPSQGFAANIWQGTFPTTNTAEDGWRFTAPVREFHRNAYGLWQTVGNVWEWCNDWFDANYYRHSPVIDPLGPPEGRRRVLRGGSFLCHDSYCNRYRNSARSSNTPNSSMSNAGFRTVAI